MGPSLYKRSEGPKPTIMIGIMRLSGSSLCCLTELELEVSDGGRRTLRGGEILLMEDVTGRGHRTRNIEPCEGRSLFVVLDEGTVVD